MSDSGWNIAGSSTIFSSCGLHRLKLTRQVEVGNNQTVIWVMLNPSIANNVRNDQTMRKVMAFSKLFGFGRVIVLNVFSLVATKPSELKRANVVVHEDWKKVFEGTVRRQHPVICAWGGSVPKKHAYQLKFTKSLLFSCAASMECLGYTTGGEPRHPLMLPYTTKRIPYEDRTR